MCVCVIKYLMVNQFKYSAINHIINNYVIECMLQYTMFYHLYTCLRGRHWNCAESIIHKWTNQNPSLLIFLKLFTTLPNLVHLKQIFYFLVNFCFDDLGHNRVDFMWMGRINWQTTDFLRINKGKALKHSIQSTNTNVLSLSFYFLIVNQFSEVI